MSLLAMLLCVRVPIAVGDGEVIGEHLRLTSPQGIYVPFSQDPWVSGCSMISVDFRELADKNLTFNLVVSNLSSNVTSYNTKLLVGFTEFDSTQIVNVIIDGGEDKEQFLDFESNKTGTPRLHQYHYWIEDVYDDERCVGYVDGYTIGEMGPNQSIILSVTVQFALFPTNDFRIHFDAYGFTASTLNARMFPDVRNSKWDHVTLMYASLMPYVPEFPFGTILPMLVTLITTCAYIYLKRERASVR